MSFHAWRDLAATFSELRDAEPHWLPGRPAIPTRFRVDDAAAAAIGAAATAAAEIGRRRGLPAQRVGVDTRRAGTSLQSFLHLRRDGAPFPAAQGEIPTMAIYRCADGRWMHLHGALTHLRDGTLRVLGCEDRAEAIAAAVARWPSVALEEALAAAGQCGAVLRTADEWAVHPQGRALAAEPLVSIERIGDAPRRQLGPAARPLDRIRVLDLTRILAGPTCARTLAEHGAGVLRIASPRLPEVEAFLPDTSHGKRSAWLDLDEPGAADTLRALVAGADVFSQGYRSGALEARGFGAEALAQRRSGIVVVSLSAYGHRGPWATRRGWEQLAQACTGIALAHSACAADAERLPAVIPAAPSDYCSGYLAALGATIALLRQCEQGGSWHVRVSLARTATWIHGLGRLPGDAIVEPPTRAEIEAWSITRDTPWGRLSYLGPVATMSATPPGWALPSTPPGSHPAAWW